MYSTSNRGVCAGSVRRNQRTARRVGVLVLAGALAVAACGGDDNSSATATTASSPATTVEASAASSVASTAGNEGAAGDAGAPIAVLPTEPYVESDEVGEVPDLPERVAFANLGDAEIFTLWGDAMRSTASDVGLEYVTASADFDAVTNVEQIRSFITRGVGGMLVIDLDVPSQRPAVCEAMQTGAAVFTISFGPGTSQLMADQYATGKAAAEALVGYIDDSLGGEAQVVVFNQDDKEGIRPRYEAIREVIGAAGDGIEIVVDQLTQVESQEWGFEAMNTILQSNPDVRAIIGADDVVLGALAALDAAGVNQDEYVIAGINGTGQALEAVSDPDDAFRFDVAYGLAPVGVAAARYAQYWLEGRAIPQVIQFTPVVLDSAEAVDEFNADMADPVAIFGTPKQEKYFTMLGSISYETRGAYYDGTGVNPHGDDVDQCDVVG
jgi:ribose transport system substrate-binding protein